MDLSWLDVRPAPRDLSARGQWARRRALIIRAMGWTTLAEAAREFRIAPQRLRRLLERGRREHTRQRRPCKCGCPRLLPRGATAAAKYATDSCKKRAYRARRR
jgi:hypothetical protein